MSNMRRFGGLALALIAGFVLIFSSGCSTVSTQSDQVALHYEDGAFASIEYEDCVPAGKRVFDGPGDAHYSYPKGQRTFDFSEAEGAESGVLTVVSKDNQELQISGILTFNLDTDCKDDGGMLRQFHENIGLKYSAYMDEDGDGTTSAGWGKMLDAYMGQPLEKTLNTVAQQYDWLALYNDSVTRVAFETAVSEQLGAAIETTAGGAYFENFSLTLQKPKPNAALVEALAAVQVALTEHDAIEQENQNIADAATGWAELVEVFGEEGAVVYEVFMACINAEVPPPGCPDFMVVPQGTNLSMPVPVPAE